MRTSCDEEPTNDNLTMLTVAEVAARLKVEHKCVRKLIKDGKLRAIRLNGRLLRIREADYEAFLEASYV